MNYRPRSVIHTLDGGCLISGLRYDASGTPQPVLESFLLKLDAYGNFDPVYMEESTSNASVIKCYPSPAKTDLYFDLPLEQTFSLGIFDVMGKKVLWVNQIKSHEIINIEELNPGIYFFHIASDQKHLSGKFIRDVGLNQAEVLLG